MEPLQGTLPKATAVYARVSTARQEEDGTIQTQLTALGDHAVQNQLQIVAEYIDDGWSGDTLTRPQLDQLRSDAKAAHRPWSVLLIYDPDRLARRYSYQELVMDELRESGVEIMFMTVAAPKNPEDKILHGVRGLFAEYERAKIRERFRLGKLRSIKEGNIIVSRPLYGYDRTSQDSATPSRYVINEREAAVVRTIFAWVADEGLTLYQVARRLQHQGILPRQSARGVWNRSTLGNMMNNEAYIGRAHWFSSVAVEPKRPIVTEKYRKNRKTSKRMRPRSEWMFIPVPALIEEELFYRARERLKANSKLWPRNRKYNYLLTGKVFCACGKRRIGAARQQGKYLYYDCTDKILRFPAPKECLENPINASVADNLVWTRLVQLMSSAGLMREQVNRLAQSLSKAPEGRACDRTAVESEIATLKVREERCERAYADGLYSLERFREYVIPMRARIAELQEQAVAAETSLQELHRTATADELEKFAATSGASLSDLDFARKRRIILHVVDKVAGTRSALRITGHIPISINGGFETDDRNWLDEDHKKLPFEFEIELPPPRYVTRKGVNGSASDHPRSSIPQAEPYRDKPGTLGA